MMRNAEEEDDDDLVNCYRLKSTTCTATKKGQLAVIYAKRKEPGAHLVNLNRMMLSHDRLIAVQCNAMNRCNLSIATKMKRKLL